MLERVYAYIIMEGGPLEKMRHAFFQHSALQIYSDLAFAKGEFDSTFTRLLPQRGILSFHRI